MKAAFVLRSLDKTRLLKLAESFDVPLLRANENADDLATRIARSLGVRLGWRESLQAIVEQLTNAELRNFLGDQRWEVSREHGQDLLIEVYETVRMSELSGVDLRALIMDLADSSEANRIESIFTSRKWAAYFDLRESYTLDEHGSRTGSRYLSADELARLNVANARDQDLVADLAEVTGLSARSVHRRLEAAHGRTLLLNCFEDRWPSPPNAETLGVLNVADAREHGLVAPLAELTGLSPKGVVRRLNAAHGRTLLANCFADRWPNNESRLLDADELAELNVAEALRRDLVQDLAEVIGLSEGTVQRRLKDAHGRTRLVTCFEDHWPQSGRKPLGAGELAALNVADAVRGDLDADIAAITGLSEMGVRRRLNAEHGRTLLITCFADRWPSDGETVSLDELAEMNVAEALRRDLIDQIAEVTGMSAQGVRRRLNEAHGRTRLTTCFTDHWPHSPEQGASEPLEAVALIGVTVAEARERDLATSLTEITGMSPRGVRRRLNAAHGRMLLTTCFADCWPENETPDRDALATMNVAEVRERRLAAFVASLLHMPEHEVQRRLDAAHGRMLLVNCFEGEWHRNERTRERIRDPEPDSKQPWYKLRTVNRRYELLQRLGGGGFGTAFEARDLRFEGRIVVIKFPRDREKDTLDALRREFALTTALKHRHICTYYSFEEDTEFDLPFLVMEHGGESLEKMIDAGEEFGVDQSFRIVAQAADALDHIHDDNKIHGDINPGNVLVTSSGEVRLTDFGISANTVTEPRAGGAVTKVARSHTGTIRCIDLSIIP